MGIGFEEDNDYYLSLKCSYDIILKFILKIHKLDKIEEREEGVEVALTLDRAKFTNHL